jgi:hypothetical protein
MSAIPCAVVGVGQTHHKSRRLDVSFGGSCVRRSSGPWPTPT